jgi:hypothetical protein
VKLRRAAICCLALLAFFAVAGSAFADNGWPQGFGTRGGTIGPSSTVQDGALEASGPPSTCGAATPTATRDSQPRLFEVVRITNLANTPNCVRVSLDANECGGGSLQSAAYRAPFDPHAIEARYKADIGPAQAGTGQYSFRVDGGESVDITVSGSEPDTSCENYNITVDADDPWVDKLPFIMWASASEGARAGGRLYAFPAAWFKGRMGWRGVWRHPQTFQWLRCDEDGSGCDAIPGALDDNYFPVPEDVGHRIRVHETVHPMFGHGTVDSAPTDVVAPDTVPPVIKRFWQTGAVLEAPPLPNNIARRRRPTRWRVVASEAGAARFVIQRRVGKRRVRYRRVGVLRRDLPTGSQTFRFTGRIGRRTLRHGHYRVTLTVRDRSGNVSRRKTRRFRIVRH